LNAQIQKECGTATPAQPFFINTDPSLTPRILITTPYLLKVFITVFADDNGSNLAAEDTAIMRQVTNMKNFYAPHNVCFILAGMQHINSTDMNNHNSDTEAFKLSFFIVGNTVNIFIHKTLISDAGALNGTAYGIPSYLLSIAGSAINSASNRSTLAHEMGHCFGLYHTFETWPNASGMPTRAENVPRMVLCANCNLNGDLLCDTEADRDEGVDGNCNYTGSMVDSCGAEFTPNTHNIMTYGNRACRDFFTGGQGARVRTFIETTPELSNAIAPDNVTISGATLYNSGRHFILSRNQIIVQVSSFVISNTAIVNINAQSVRLSPNIRLVPSVGGAVYIRANTVCN